MKFAGSRLSATSLEVVEEMEMDFAGKEVEDTNNKPVRVEAESQTLVSGMTKETVDAATQTSEFEYLFCATKTQPFTEDYFKIQMIKLDFIQDYLTLMYS